MFEVAQGASNRLAGWADEFTNLFVGHGDLYPMGRSLEGRAALD
jgi:hypothetical protein